MTTTPLTQFTLSQTDTSFPRKNYNTSQTHTFAAKNTDVYKHFSGTPIQYSFFLEKTPIFYTNHQPVRTGRQDPHGNQQLKSTKQVTKKIRETWICLFRGFFIRAFFQLFWIIHDCVIATARHIPDTSLFADVRQFRRQAGC